MTTRRQFLAAGGAIAAVGTKAWPAMAASLAPPTAATPKSVPQAAAIAGR